MAVPESHTAATAPTSEKAASTRPGPSSPIVTLSRGLTIRAYRKSDAEENALLCNNREISKNMRDSFPSPYTLESSHAWIDRCLDPANWHAVGLSGESSSDDTRLPTAWVIALNDRPVGGIGLLFGTNVYRRQAEVGYWIGEPYWGRGYATEAVMGFMDWALNTYPSIMRYHAGVYHWNPASMRVLLNAGFEKESVQRAVAWKLDKVVDVHVFVKIREGTPAAEMPE